MSLEEDQANQETRCHLYLAEPQIRSAEGRSDNKSTFKVIFSKNTIDQNVSCLKRTSTIGEYLGQQLKWGPFLLQKVLQMDSHSLIILKMRMHLN